MDHRLFKFALIALNVLVSAHPPSAGKILTVEKFLIANGVLDENEDYQAGKQRRCISDSNCSPGQCLLQRGLSSCLCPEGFYSDRGMCKEFQWNCKMIDCKPGKCINEFEQEKCLCPEGYTSKAGSCLEITYTSLGQISTVMVMIVVAIASVMLTTFLGVCICYYTHQSRQ